jgi:restriction system protein
LQNLVATHSKEIREQLLKRLLEMHPKAFEQFCGELLRRIGFIEVSVTGYSGDGGIDGQGVLRAGPITLNVAFQVKRWTNPVGVSPIGEFRGRLGAKFERLLFITTSKFTEGACELAKEPGAAPMVLVDGDKLLDLMVEYGIGLERVPLTMDAIDEDFFAKFAPVSQ